MTKVMLMSKDNYDHNGSMMTYLKVMYYFGFLPFSWVSERDPEHFEIKFRISGLKTFIMMMIDLLLSLLVPAYLYVFNILNVDPNFDPKKLLSPNYYLSLNDSVITTTLTQVVFVAFIVVSFWAYPLTGRQPSVCLKKLKISHFIRMTQVTPETFNRNAQLLGW